MYAAAPTLMAPQGFAATPAAPPGPPQSLLQGVPDPAAVESQKGQYLKSIDGQLAQAQTLLDQQSKQQIDYMRANSDQQKKQFSFQKDMEAEKSRMALNQQYASQLNQLDDAARQQKFTLEQQSANLIADYNQKKTHEALMNEQYAMQKKAFDAQAHLQAQMAHLAQPQR